MQDTPSPARPDPYALVFDAPLFEEQTFPQVLEEASGAGLERAGPDLFMQLAAVARLLRQLAPADAPGAATRSHGAFVYHAFNHWRAGKRVLDAAPDALAAAMAGSAPRASAGTPTAPPTAGQPSGPAVTVPAPAGYVRLPRQRLWARVSEEVAAEPVDGFFWVAGGPVERPIRLDVLLVLGLRQGRPGLSVMDAGTELEEGRLPAEVAHDPRPGGTAFDNILPGGELQDYRGLVTPAESLLLATRLLANLDG